jgi:hypothetical protein
VPRTQDMIGQPQYSPVGMKPTERKGNYSPNSLEAQTQSTRKFQNRSCQWTLWPPWSRVVLSTISLTSSFRLTPCCFGANTAYIEFVADHLFISLGNEKALQLRAHDLALRRDKLWYRCQITERQHQLFREHLRLRGFVSILLLVASWYSLLTMHSCINNFYLYRLLCHLYYLIRSW